MRLFKFLREAGRQCDVTYNTRKVHQDSICSVIVSIRISSRLGPHGRISKLAIRCGYSFVATENVGEFDGMTVPFLVGNAVDGVSSSLLPATGDRVGVLENDPTCSTLFDGLVGYSLVATEDVGEFDGMTVPFLVGNSVDDVSTIYAIADSFATQHQLHH